MRVILHIGIPKTGTKTIQWGLKINRGMLKEVYQIMIPFSCLESGTSVNDVKLSAYARRDNRTDDIRSRLGLTSPATLAQFRATFEREFLDECYDAKCHTVILSSESCSSRLFFVDEIKRLQALLQKIGSVEVVLYLRKQDELWASHYSTGVKLGYQKDIAPPTPMQKRDLLDYEGLCNRWSEVFGLDFLRVRIFDHREFIAGDLLVDFFGAANVNVDASSLRKPAPQNRALDPKLLEFLRRFNKFLPYTSKSTNFKPDPRQGNLMAILEGLTTGNHQIMDRDWRRGLMAEFAEGNRHVARRFLGRADGRLFREDDADEPPSEESPSFTMDDAFEIFAKIWAAKHQPGNPPRQGEAARRSEISRT
jgi:hypothetical protein